MQFQWGKSWLRSNFLAQIRSQLPNARVFVSVSTLAGRATAVDKLRGLADGIFYAPVDFVFVVRRVLRALQPSVVVIAETEIWPNLFRETKRTCAALVLVNGRISDRAFPRYRRFGWLFRAVLPAVDAILAQSDEMRDRFLAIGRSGCARAHGWQLQVRFRSPAGRAPIRRCRC